MTLPKDPEYYRYADDGSLAWVGCGIILLAMAVYLAILLFVIQLLVAWVAM